MKREIKYEFDAQQNAVISALGKRMTIVGVILIVAGIPPLLLLIKGNLVATVIGAIYIIMGLLSMNASFAFRRIVTTKDFDIEHLMEALTSLKNYYTIELIVFLTAAAILGYLYFFMQ